MLFVELRGIEPLSENQFPVLLLSYLVLSHSLHHTKTSTLMALVASCYARIRKA